MHRERELFIGYVDGGSRFALPLEAVTQTFAILAKRGMGKTATATVLAEELLEQKMQVVVIDPLDSWYGLRSSADGKHPGHQVVVLGGERGDLPLGPGDGSLIADFVVDNHASVVLSLRHFSNTGARTFVTDFLEHLYHRKGESKNRTPMHIIIDEADAFCPQRLSPDTARCFGAVDVVVRRGRSSGLGVTLISQRSAAVNKDCLTQTECLVCLRTTSPQDRKAIEAWIEHHADTAEAVEFMKTLSQLPVGTAWFWAPGWLGPLKKVEVRRRHTFDSSATPKIGDKVVEPQKIAAVDLEALRSKLAVSLEKKKADDPKELRKQIAALTAELAKKLPSLAPDLSYQKAERAFLSGCAYTANMYMNGVRSISVPSAVPDHISLGVPKPGDVKQSAPLRGDWRQDIPQAPRPPSGSPVRRGIPKDALSQRLPGNLGRCERSILSVLANYPQGRDKSQIALMSGYSGNSGGFNNALAKLRTHGFIEGNGVMKSTPSAADVIGDVEPLPPPGPELLAHWIPKLDRCQRAILECLAENGGEMSKEQIGEATRYSPNSGGFNNALSKLRTLELIEGRGTIQLHELLR